MFVKVVYRTGTLIESTQTFDGFMSVLLLNLQDFCSSKDKLMLKHPADFHLIYKCVPSSPTPVYQTQMCSFS